MKKIGILLLTGITLFILVSCSGAGSEEKTITNDNSIVDQTDQQPAKDVSVPESTHEPMQEEINQPEELGADGEHPEWQQLILVNARNGESFRLSDFSGKPVFVEPMATWCSNCRRQLTNVRAAKEQLGDDTVFIALSVETNIDNTTLANYADDAGFDWLFAVATPELLEGLTAEFGRAIVNPPATPHFIIKADGSYTELFTGIEPAGDIISRIAAAKG